VAQQQQQMQGFLASVTWIRASACIFIIPAVSYLSTGLAGCSVGSGISCGARKLARTPRVTKKKKYIYIYIYIYIYVSGDIPIFFIKKAIEIFVWAAPTNSLHVIATHCHSNFQEA